MLRAPAIVMPGSCGMIRDGGVAGADAALSSLTSASIAHSIAHPKGNERER